MRKPVKFWTTLPVRWYLLHYWLLLYAVRCTPPSNSSKIFSPKIYIRRTGTHFVRRRTTTRRTTTHDVIRRKDSRQAAYSTTTWPSRTRILLYFLLLYVRREREEREEGDKRLAAVEVFYLFVLRFEEKKKKRDSTGAVWEGYVQGDLLPTKKKEIANSRRISVLFE